MAENSKKVGHRPRGKSTEDIQNELNLNSDSGEDNLVNSGSDDSDDSQNEGDGHDFLVEVQLTFDQLEEDLIPVFVAEDVPRWMTDDSIDDGDIGHNIQLVGGPGLVRRDVACSQESSFAER